MLGMSRAECMSMASALGFGLRPFQKTPMSELALLADEAITAHFEMDVVSEVEAFVEVGGRFDFRWGDLSFQVPAL